MLASIDGHDSVTLAKDDGRILGRAYLPGPVINVNNLGSGKVGVIYESNGTKMCRIFIENDYTYDEGPGFPL
jgi:hypothetical protein